MKKTTDLCDACDAALTCQLPFIGYGRRQRFCGGIRTMRYGGGVAALRDLVHEAGAGQVLVIDGAGMLSGALFGDVLAMKVIQNGWAGVIVNGLIRDRAEIDAMDIGVKALGTLPKRVNIDGPSDRDEAVSFGGVTFTPGLHVVADEDGVIVLPPGLTVDSIDVTQAVSATAVYAAGLRPGYFRA